MFPFWNGKQIHLRIRVRRNAHIQKLFNELLQDAGETEESKKLLDLFPGLNKAEKGLTCDQLFALAAKPVIADFWRAYGPYDPDHTDEKKVKEAYAATTAGYDKYSLRSFVKEKARWSQDAINLFVLGNAHVVFENGFIESLKDAFLSSNDQGKQAYMQQLQHGIDTMPSIFVSPDRGNSGSVKVPKPKYLHINIQRFFY